MMSRNLGIQSTSQPPRAIEIHSLTMRPPSSILISLLIENFPNIRQFLRVVISQDFLQKQSRLRLPTLQKVSRVFLLVDVFKRKHNDIVDLGIVSRVIYTKKRGLLILFLYNLNRFNK